ncbi:MAG: histidine phosphatase family protein [Catenulisporales bacterium]|nr:histidine phosphatase family protein [Catenulisporales bacterium]
MSELILLRHGETEWSRAGRHTGLTDLPLTARGEDQARAAAKLLAERSLAAVYTSPLSRAMRTAELAGLTGAVPEPDLLEWDYGGYEGVTTDEIHHTRPGWYLWNDGVVPGDAEHPGESLEQVGARVDRVLARVRPMLADGEGEEDVCLVAHGHVLRIVCARWLGLPPAGGRYFRLDTATVSRLGFEHARPVVDGLNLRG